MDKREKIQAELEAIRGGAGGVLKAEDVVEFARDKKTALHDEFTWDNSKAAHEYRLWQARQVIKVFVDVVAADTDPVPVYVSLTSDRANPGGGYRALKDVLSVEAHREQLLADALKDLQRFQSRYSALKELHGVMAAAQKAIDKIERKRAPRGKAAAMSAAI